MGDIGVIGLTSGAENFWYPANTPIPAPFVYVAVSTRTPTEQRYTIHHQVNPVFDLAVCMTSGVGIPTGGSGHTACGTIIGVHGSVCDSTVEFGVVCAHNLAQTNIPSALGPPGSSGAPFWKAHAAYGVLSGVDSKTGDIDFTPIRTAQSALGVTIATG